METVGLIAGRGRFPQELARALRSGGRRVVALGLRELADAALEGCVDALEWVHLGELERLFELLRAARVGDVVLAGKVPKTFLWERPDAIRLDERARAVLAGLADRADDSLLGAVATAIEAEGFRLRGQVELAPSLVAGEGVLGKVHPTAAQLRDVAFGWPIAKALGGLDVGQTVVVQGGAVLALEAVEGTDVAIRRGCGLGEPGACVIKVAKPRQDPRFDVPVVGPDTVERMVEGSASLLAVEAHRSVLLERERTLARADSRGIAVVGVVEGPAPELGESSP